MNITLREIADALCDSRNNQPTEEERQRIYDRARMLRDKGYIASTKPSQRGKAMTFTEADVVAAVIVMSASLDGMSWGVIGAINQDLRSIGNTQGKPMYEHFLGEIKSGNSIFIRLEVRSQPWGHTEATMGRDDLLAVRPTIGTTLVLIWPVTDLAAPVLDILDRN